MYQEWGMLKPLAGLVAYRLGTMVYKLGWEKLWLTLFSIILW